jgi:hypothetical protein
VPHVVVKLWPGQADQQKQHLSSIIIRGVMDSQASNRRPREQR